MLGRTRMMLAGAVCAVITLSVAARAEDTTKQHAENAPAAQSTGATPPVPPTAAAAATPPKPLMSLLDAAGELAERLVLLVPHRFLSPFHPSRCGCTSV